LYSERREGCCGEGGTVPLVMREVKIHGQACGTPQLNLKKKQQKKNKAPALVEPEAPHKSYFLGRLREGEGKGKRPTTPTWRNRPRTTGHFLEPWSGGKEGGMKSKNKTKKLCKKKERKKGNTPAKGVQGGERKKEK